MVTASLVFALTGNVSAITSYDGTAPTAPTNVKAAAHTSSPTRVVITWNQAQDNIGVTRYNIYKNGTFMVTPQGVGVTFTDTDVVAGQTYTYAIQAGDGDGNNGPQSDTIEIVVNEGAVSKVVSPPQMTSGTSTQTTVQQTTSVYSNVSQQVSAPQTDHPEAVTMTAYTDRLEIAWKNPIGNTFKTVRVIKKDTSFPLSPTDGKVICDSLVVMKCIDREVVANKTYYYAVYAADQSYLASQFVTVSGMLLEKKASVVQVSSPAAGIGTSVENGSMMFTKVLTIGSVGQEVLNLQKFLNTHGYVIAATGAGSPGNETMSFGRATQTALQKYQCAKKIVCDGTPSSTGYGMVGKTTRMNLNMDSNSQIKR
jgi:hypothetical protein